MKNPIKFWDGVADKYAADPIKDMESYVHTRERTRSYLTAESTVLEIGCGTGSTALELAESAGHILATDLSPRMIEIGQDKARAQGIENVSFRAASIDGGGLGEDQFDVVTSFNLLHLSRETEGALAKIFELTRPGGYFISKTPCLRGAGVPFAIKLATRVAIPIMQLVGKAPFVRLLSVKELDAAVKAAGFEIVETDSRPLRPPSRYIVARRPA